MRWSRAALPAFFRFLAALCSAIVVTALAGCATPQGGSSTTAAVPQLKSRPVAATFSVSGRIAARVNAGAGEPRHGFSGGFSWIHKPGEDVVELLTPLGQIAARVTLTRAGATIELAGGQRTTTSEPEPYIARVLGINLPLVALPYWMQGAPVPSIAMQAEADSAGRPAMLWQNGWEIRYSEYADASAAARPVRIDLTQGDVEARIVIDEWKMNEPGP